MVGAAEEAHLDVRLREIVDRRIVRLAQDQGVVGIGDDVALELRAHAPGAGFEGDRMVGAGDFHAALLFGHPTRGGPDGSAAVNAVETLTASHFERERAFSSVRASTLALAQAWKMLEKSARLLTLVRR